MRGYFEILTELKEALETDALPAKNKKQAERLLEELFDLLWKYSD